MNKTLVMFAIAIPVAILAIQDVFMGIMGVFLMIAAALFIDL